MPRLLTDIRYAVRILRLSPGFALTAIGAIALGIGACTAIFSVVNKVLLEPLPYPEPDRLVQLMSVSQLGDQSVVSIPKYVIWKNRTSAFRYIAAYDAGSSGVNLTQAPVTEPLETAHVSADYFRLFGAEVEIGRTFSAARTVRTGREWRLSAMLSGAAGSAVTPGSSAVRYRWITSPLR